MWVYNKYVWKIGKKYSVGFCLNCCCFCVECRGGMGWRMGIRNWKTNMEWMLCRFDQSWQPITLKWIGWQCSNASIQFCSSTITNSYLMFVFFDNDNDIDTFCHRMAVIVYSWQTSNFVGSMWLVEIGFMHHCKHSIHHFVCVCVFAMKIALYLFSSSPGWS